MRGGRGITCSRISRRRVRPYEDRCGLLAHIVMQSENFTAPDAAFAAAGNISWIDGVHGFEGPVQSTYPNYFFPGSGKNKEAVFRCSHDTPNRLLIRSRELVDGGRADWRHPMP